LLFSIEARGSSKAELSQLSGNDIPGQVAPSTYATFPLPKNSSWKRGLEEALDFLLTQRGAVQLESGRVRKMTETKIPAAIRVDWWYGERVLKCEEELRAELAENYAVSIVRTRRGGLGGGLYQLFVEFLSQLTLQEVARVVLEGMAFDLIKSGTKAFLIRPFLDAYQRFKSRQNEEKRVGIDRFRLVFQDAAITIDNLPHTDLLAELGNIFQAVAENLEPMTPRGSNGFYTKKQFHRVSYSKKNRFANCVCNIPSSPQRDIL
jgi:hypothetical protein